MYGTLLFSSLRWLKENKYLSLEEVTGYLNFPNKPNHVSFDSKLILFIHFHTSIPVCNKYHTRPSHCLKGSLFGVFLVRIFPHFDWIWRDTEYLSVFSLNSEKYGPEKLWIHALFTQWLFWYSCVIFSNLVL